MLLVDRAAGDADTSPRRGGDRPGVQIDSRPAQAGQLASAQADEGQMNQGRMDDRLMLGRPHSADDGEPGGAVLGEQLLDLGVAEPVAEVEGSLVRVGVILLAQRFDVRDQVSLDLAAPLQVGPDGLGAGEHGVDAGALPRASPGSLPGLQVLDEVLDLLVGDRADDAVAEALDDRGERRGVRLLGGRVDALRGEPSGHGLVDGRLRAVRGCGGLLLPKLLLEGVEVLAGFLRGREPTAHLIALAVWAGGAVAHLVPDGTAGEGDFLYTITQRHDTAW
ncbi:hypothetical protein MYK68_00935 [Gordonia sp. PP30]|uniref:hypothetical protein n=1 Tax=Gordonia sp. PP30 TaxID=2935861 RepID=UPI001FFE724E|nr:hypothetical protein [Gordonia sp. PP30]UQE75240.1 hypothetical protein MYK68_00935 [Gordonia sp. PP30]